MTQLPQNEQLGDFMQRNTEEWHYEDKKFGLFRNEATKKVLHAYLPALESGKKGKTEDEDVESSIIALVCLDERIMTIITCLKDSDTRGGRWKKL